MIISCLCFRHSLPFCFHSATTGLPMTTTHRAYGNHYEKKKTSVVGWVWEWECALVLNCLNDCCLVWLRSECVWECIVLVMLSRTRIVSADDSDYTSAFNFISYHFTESVTFPNVFSPCLINLPHGGSVSFVVKFLSLSWWDWVKSFYFAHLCFIFGVSWSFAVY